jgi:rhodanese-related sulfurtransferase
MFRTIQVTPGWRWMLLAGLCAMACLSQARAAPPGRTENDHIVSPETIDGVVIVDAEGLIEKVTRLPDLVLIDSRIPADRAEGYIEGSISLPDENTSCATLARVLPGLTTPVLFYCNGIRCGRSARAVVIARDCGYRDLYWFRNGMEEWQQKKYPLVQ